MNSLFHFVMIFECVVPLLEKQQEFVVPPSKKCVIPPLENSLVLSPLKKSSGEFPSPEISQHKDAFCFNIISKADKRLKKEELEQRSLCLSFFSPPFVLILLKNEKKGQLTVESSGKSLDL